MLVIRFVTALLLAGTTRAAQQAAVGVGGAAVQPTDFTAQDLARVSRPAVEHFANARASMSAC